MCGPCPGVLGSAVFFLDFGWSWISPSASDLQMLLQTGSCPECLQSLDGFPQRLPYWLDGVSVGWIPNCMSTSHCVMTTLHLDRDDRGKENAVSPPFHMVSRFELKVGTSLQVWSA